MIKVKIEIKNRWTLAVMFTADIECEESASVGVRLGLAVKWQIKNTPSGQRADLSGAVLRDADLRDADLSGADLRGAVLRGADLRGAVLRGAVLRDADLRGAVLRDAVLRDADLRGADLSDAVLSGAVLRDADLRGADLSDAVLSGADLRGAVLRDADLRGAVLRGADLRGAVLRGAVLTPVKNDLFLVLLSAPAEVGFLRQALVDGKVDGSTYSGDCACLVGTIANARKCSVNDLGILKPDANRPIERFFTAIRPGGTPDKNPCAKLAVEWVDEFIAIQKEAAVVFGNQAK